MPAKAFRAPWAPTSANSSSKPVGSGCGDFLLMWRQGLASQRHLGRRPRAEMAACRWQLQFEDLPGSPTAATRSVRQGVPAPRGGPWPSGSNCASNGCYPAAGLAWRAPRPSSRALRAAAVGQLGAVKLKDRTARQVQKARRLFARAGRRPTAGSGRHSPALTIEPVTATGRNTSSPRGPPSSRLQRGATTAPRWSCGSAARHHGPLPGARLGGRRRGRPDAAPG
jgi:hypothetical protein